MIKTLILCVVIVTLVFSLLQFLIKKYAHGKYSGIWHIIASCIYFCLIFICAYLFQGLAE